VPFLFCLLASSQQVSCPVASMRGVFKKFDEWYEKTNITEDTNKLTLLAFKIIAILHNTLLATFINTVKFDKLRTARHYQH
jgi:hypothetical protein